MMARAVSIWVVMDGTNIAAAFTVKHELRTWLNRRSHPFVYRVYRCQDNPIWPDAREPEEIEISDLVPC